MVSSFLESATTTSCGVVLSFLSLSLPHSFSLPLLLRVSFNTLSSSSSSSFPGIVVVIVGIVVVVVVGMVAEKKLELESSNYITEFFPLALSSFCSCVVSSFQWKLGKREFFFALSYLQVVVVGALRQLVCQVLLMCMDGILWIEGARPKGSCFSGCMKRIMGILCSFQENCKQ